MRPVIISKHNAHNGDGVTCIMSYTMARNNAGSDACVHVMSCTPCHDDPTTHLRFAARVASGPSLPYQGKVGPESRFFPEVSCRGKRILSSKYRQVKIAGPACVGGVESLSLGERRLPKGRSARGVRFPLGCEPCFWILIHYKLWTGSESSVSYASSFYGPTEFFSN